jgi:glucosamine-6-phosphate deaminase
MLRPVRIEIRPTAAAACRAVADEIEGLIRQHAARGAPLRLGLPTGSTPRRVYAELVRRHRERGLSFRGVTTFNLDEYWPMEPGDPRSFAAFMRSQLFEHVNLPSEQAHVPDGNVAREDLVTSAADYERRLCAAGGADLILLGLGRNGHVAFDEPGSAPDSRTRLVLLSPSSRRDAGGDVPGHAISIGLHTIRRARRLRLLVTGAAKAEIVERALRGPVTRDVPASLLRGHPDFRVVLDADAAGLLRR